jgi:hypothetical protein
MIWFYITLGALHATRMLWLYYAAAMLLLERRNSGELTKEQTVLGKVALVEGLLLDLVVHLTVGSIVFWELPAKREYTLSARIWRLSNGAPGWRQRFAFKVRTRLLDSLDPKRIHRA